MNDTRRVFVAFAVLALFASLHVPEASAADAKPHAFENEIRKFEEQDIQTTPPESPILFVGSSSIRFWDVARSFPGLPVMNRGFGGSQVADSVYFADRIVLKYKPRVIVFYAGDNDLASGKTPAQVCADFEQFVAKVRSALPQTRIVYISIKPSLARWKLIDAGRETNRLIAAAIKSDPRITLIDVEPAMLGTDGKPRGELFLPDGLHLNAKGYEAWTALVRPVLDKVE